jgi:protein involved in polysaccharide export with SLBB domain
MSRNLRFTAAFLVVMHGFAATSQEINKGDLPDPRAGVDQSPISVGELPSSTQAPLGSKSRISNAGTLATDSSTVAKTGSGGSRDVQQHQTVIGAGAAASARPSEFQKFMLESTGKMLPVYGTEFFGDTPSTFAPIQNTPVPSDYTLGPGDEVLIRGWGSIDVDFRATIDRNGLVNIPVIGALVLGGVRAADATSVIRGAVGKLYKDVTLNVTFGQLRAITVYVVGQAMRPGTYTVSSMSTLVTALFASGGPNASGSMRSVQVKRGGKVVGELDLYAFIGKGDKASDIKLHDGDTIFIPAAKGFVAVVGKVNQPAIFELRSDADSIASVLEFAGGLPVVADPHRAFLERVNATQKPARTVEQFALDAAGLKKPLRDGDLLSITSITPEFANAVVLRGSVDQAIRAPFKTGMKITDLIPSREYLITRSSVNRQNNAHITGDDEKQTRENADSIASRIGGLIEEINWDYAVVERVNRSDVSVSLIPFNLGKALDNPGGVANVLLQPGDTVTVFSQKDVMVPIEKRRVFVRVEGEVVVPGVYQMNAGENLAALLARAGGPTRDAYLFGTALYREQVKRDQEANMVRVINRLEANLRAAQSRGISDTSAGDVQARELRRQSDLAQSRDSLNRMRQLSPTGRIAFSLSPKEASFDRLPQMKLENGDRLVVPPRPDFVHIFGAVNAEASPLWRPGASAGDYLKRAGVTPDADIANTFILRADGSVVAEQASGWFARGVLSTEIMAGDTIVVPERMNRETAWSKFTVGTREWAQIFANFGLGAAAIRTLR